MNFIDDRRLRRGLLAALCAMTGCGGGPPAAGGDAEPVPASAVTNGPVGAGAGVTGGAGGAAVRVGTPAQLKYELCRSSAGGVCTDTTPRIIEIATTIDLGDYSEGTATAKGCDGKLLFDVRYNAAAVRGMIVGSNKTVLGIGANAAVKGKGFQLQNGVSNVVIRNLSITDIDEGLVSGGDALTIADASRVWIDHNRFARVGRRFIVTGTGDHSGAAADVTISWNEFDGNSAWSARCDDKHYWNLLFYGKGRLTFANNWLHDFSGRGPRIEGDALVQVVNNHFQDGSWHAIDTAGSGTRVLVEGNYFEEVPVPVLHNPDAGSLHGLLAQTDASTSACSAALGRSCAVNIAQPAPPADGFTEDAAVLAAAKAAPTGSIVRPYPARKVPAVVSAGVGVGHVR
jgi:pectate lyase